MRSRNSSITRIMRLGIALVGAGLLLLLWPGWAFADTGNGASPTSLPTPAHSAASPVLPAAVPTQNPAHVVQTSPQPPSNGDFSGNGANVHGPYDSTRSGAPSLNGNGTGAAVGKPCAGCVGKADNKNPRGQLPNGSDPNAGYECDRNHGIGRTNPAHTGCIVVTVPTLPPPPSTKPPGVTPPGSHSGGSANGVSPVAVAQAAPGNLAATGTNSSAMVTLGVGLLVAGALISLLAAVRRRTSYHVH